MANKLPIDPASTKAERTRARILDVAQRDASLAGVDSLTIGGLAQSCGLSKSGLIAHFGSKEALQLAVIDATAMRFLQEVAEPAFAVEPGRERLVAIMEHWIAWSQHPDRPGGCQLIAATFDFDGLESEVRTGLQGWIAQWRAAITGAAQEAAAAAEISLDPDRVATLAFGIYVAQHIERFLLGDEAAATRALDIWRHELQSPT